MRFELGDPNAPRGHALLYFRDANNPKRVLATYLVLPPIAMDLAKYVPPLLAAQLPGGIPAAPSVYPLPPFPEPFGSLGELTELATARGDDLLDGGSLTSGDLQRMVMAVSEVGERYASMYREARERAPRLAPEAPRELEGLDVDTILMGMMTDSEKVGRLVRHLGTLRYAVGGGDSVLANETLTLMENVGRRLDSKYRVAELLAAAREPGPRGQRLSELYAERCYKLAAEEYAEVAELERRIDDARA